MLTFNHFQETNFFRSNSAFPECNCWDETDWALALAGETGGACNWIKKWNRGDITHDQMRAEVKKELADVITYASRLASHLQIDLEEAVIDKFNEVSVRKGSTYTL